MLCLAILSSGFSVRLGLLGPFRYGYDSSVLQLLTLPERYWWYRLPQSLHSVGLLSYVTPAYMEVITTCNYWVGIIAAAWRIWVVKMGESIELNYVCETRRRLQYLLLEFKIVGWKVSCFLSLLWLINYKLLPNMGGYTVKPSVYGKDLWKQLTLII